MKRVRTARRLANMKRIDLATCTLVPFLALSAASNGAVYEQIGDGAASKVQPDLGLTIRDDGLYRWHIHLWEGGGSTDADDAPAGPLGRG